MIKEKTINIFVLLLLLAIPVFALITDEPYYITLTTKVVILAIAGVGLNFALGYGGLISFGHAAFFGIGGYVSGILIYHVLNYVPMFEWPFFFEGSNNLLVILILSILISAIFATIIGLLTLRTGGVYFIMITLAFAQMIYYFAISFPDYGGEDGLSVYLRSNLFGLNLMDGMNFFLVCFAILLATLLLVHYLTNSRFGLTLSAVKANEERVLAVGITPFRIKLIAFVISATITAVAGALYTDLNRFVSPTSLSWHMSGEIMIFVILGGVARLMGPVVGAIIFILLEVYLGGITDSWQFWLGLILVIVVLFAKGGIIGLLTQEKEHV